MTMSSFLLGTSMTRHLAFLALIIAASARASEPRFRLEPGLELRFTVKVCVWFDGKDGNRTSATVNVGTYAGSSWSRPSTVPGRSATVLVNSMTYDAAGRVDSTTDPRGIVGKTEYDDLGRTTKRIENYVNGVPSNQDDKTTEFGYDSVGHLTSYKAWLNSTDYQETGYEYGVTTAGGSGVNSNDLLKIEKYPDKSTGAPSTSSTDQVSYKYNALGQRVAMTDRNGTIHDYTFDVVGRSIADMVTIYDSAVDSSVLRIETAYDSAGRSSLFSSYNSRVGGTVVNQVQRDYNGFGQIIKEWQQGDGSVTVNTPNVQYTYSEAGSGANHSRLTSMVYPASTRTLSYNYDGISRLTSIGDGSITLEIYDYLGLGTVVKRAHAQSGVDLTYIGSGTGEAGDQYVGLDRFGRIVDQRWANGSTDKNRFKYGYDEDGNRLYRTNELDHNFDELYHADGATAGYDGLNQLQEFQRGTLNSTKDAISGESRRQVWSPDALGNFTSVVTDSNTETRSHNRQNQLTQLVNGSTTTPLTYDNAGNTTNDGIQSFSYDAWNRLIKANSSVRYAYDAMNRRLKEGARTFVYSSQWQVVAEYNSGTLLYTYAWSPVYVDAMIARDEGSTRLYVLADANFNVTALVSTSGTVLERYVYDPYGKSTKLSSSWGTYSGTDRGWVYLHQGGRFVAGSGMYHFRRRDLNSELGRWDSVDPIGFSALDSNLYRYESANPSCHLDPIGLQNITPGGTIKGGSIVSDAGQKFIGCVTLAAQCAADGQNQPKGTHFKTTPVCVYTSCGVYTWRRVCFDQCRKDSSGQVAAMCGVCKNRDHPWTRPSDMYGSIFGANGFLDDVWVSVTS